MRIHHIINSYALAHGGAERLVRRLHIMLRKHQVSSYLFGLLALQKEDSLPFARSMDLQSPYGVRAFYGVYQYVRQNVENDDIVHAHLFPTILYLSVLKKTGILKAKLIYTEHSTSNRRRGKWYGKIIDIIAYAGCDKVVAISHGAKAEILSWKPELSEKALVVQNGVALAFPDVIKRNKKECPVIVSVGRICEAKNYLVMLKSIALLKDMKFEYRVVGDGPDLVKLQDACVEIGLMSRVEFLGYVADVSPLLAQADIFLIASRWEGFGLAAVEAMNASLPIVASDIPGLREVVSQNPSCALLVDFDNPESIAEALADLLTNEHKRLKLGKEAFVHSQLFDEGRMVKSYMELYAKMLGVTS